MPPSTCRRMPGPRTRLTIHVQATPMAAAAIPPPEVHWSEGEQEGEVVRHEQQLPEAADAGAEPAHPRGECRDDSHPDHDPQGATREEAAEEEPRHGGYHRHSADPPMPTAAFTERDGRGEHRDQPGVERRVDRVELRDARERGHDEDREGDGRHRPGGIGEPCIARVDEQVASPDPVPERRCSCALLLRRRPD
jgi:hypothetical protein